LNMKIVFIVRSTIFTAKGGDTIQVQETAAGLRNLGVEVDIIRTSEKINYPDYDLLHFFNITRPADILLHVKTSAKPFVVSTILINYGLYDKHHRYGIAGKLFNIIPASGIEYAKTLFRFLAGRDKLVSTAYLWKGQHASIKEILGKAKAVLVQAKEEYDDLVKLYTVESEYYVIKNGINAGLFQYSKTISRDKNTVLSVARFEGLKNQYNLIKAINNSAYKLVLIGDAAPSQKGYYQKCREIASGNVSFISYLPQQQLTDYYAMAKVHVLPSWFEVCGLSSLEAAAMGCNIVITDNGYTRSYFGDDAFYCDPEKPESILQAIDRAMQTDCEDELQKKIRNTYSWKKTAEDTLAVYKRYIS
jgi:glycosyltransferase involved in cell wall biosynthesis